MGLPFTHDEFFGIFAEYNRIFWPVVGALWLVTAGAVVATWRSPARCSSALTHLLGFLWAWNAVAYHAFLFTRINPAAWLFSALFAVQALLLFRAGARQQAEYFMARGPMHVAGVGLVGYALAYPFISVALGHDYPAAPTFGVPCPTAILTIGVLLTMGPGGSGRESFALAPAVIPAVWGFIGGSAAVLLTVTADYALLGAGMLMTAVLIVRVMRATRARG